MAIEAAEATLESFEDLSPSIRSFRFRAPVSSIQFIPGQWVSILLPGETGIITRAYSIAAIPDSQSFEIALNLVEEGRLSPRLFALSPGDKVQFKGPLGDFLFRSAGRESILVATGTGVVPFRAMLLANPFATANTSIGLIQGARFAAGLIYNQEFQILQSQQPNFRYLPTLTQAPQGWLHRVGRVQPILLAEIESRPEADVYLCGLREMVDDLRQQLKALGIPRQRIFYERYN